ncbi:MAG TPA: HD domain-containing phosphohydrolase [Candidatus Deferrimicrobiaceae bacterium]
MDRRQQEQVIGNVIRLLGTSLKNRKLYPPTHPSVRTPVEKCFSDLLLFFADRKELALAIADGTLVFEGVPIFSLTSSLELFMQRLTAIGIPALIFDRGLTSDEIEGFIRFLHETTEEGLDTPEIQRQLLARGVLHIRVRRPDEDEEDDLALAREIYDNAVNSVVSVLQEVRMGRIPSGAESERVVGDLSSMLRRNRDAILALTLIKNYDEYTYNHSVNVSVIALALADALAITTSEKIEIGVAGLLHDVGKTQLALDLIRKPGELTHEEFAEIKKHPEEGFVLLGKMPHIHPGSAHMVREHHLRFDRKGYPDLDPEHRIHPYSQIIAVADCFDALTTMRSYQKARTPLEALELMRKIGGKSVDPNYVAVLSKIMGSYPIGTMVRLTTMEVGVVIGMGLPGQGPSKVAVLFDPQGNPLPRPEHQDLTVKDPKTGKPLRTILGTVNPLLYSDAGKELFQQAPLPPG